MAGRNWTRKSIEELVDGFIRKNASPSDKKGINVKDISSGGMSLSHSYRKLIGRGGPDIEGYDISLNGNDTNRLEVSIFTESYNLTNKAANTSWIYTGLIPNTNLLSLTHAYYIETSVGDPIGIRYSYSPSKHVDIQYQTNSFTDSITGDTFSYKVGTVWYPGGDPGLLNIIDKIDNYPQADRPGVFIFSDYNYTDDELIEYYGLTQIVEQTLV